MTATGAWTLARIRNGQLVYITDTVFESIQYIMARYPRQVHCVWRDGRSIDNGKGGPDLTWWRPSHHSEPVAGVLGGDRLYAAGIPGLPVVLDRDWNDSKRVQQVEGARQGSPTPGCLRRRRNRHGFDAAKRL